MYPADSICFGRTLATKHQSWDYIKAKLYTINLGTWTLSAITQTTIEASAQWYMSDVSEDEGELAERRRATISQPGEPRLLNLAIVGFKV